MRQEPVHQQLTHLFAITSTCRPPPISREPDPGRFTVRRSRSVVAEQFFLHALTTAHQHVPLMGQQSALPGKFLFQVPRQSQIQVVAAQDQMVADGDAVELNAVCIVTAAGCLGVAPAGAGADANQREVGRAAADIANQNRLARLYPRLPVVAMLVDPGIEGRLRFFDQHDARQFGPRRRLHGQLASDLVERSGQRQHDILLGQRVPRESCAFQASRMCRKMRALASTGDSRSTSAAPCQGNRSAVRSTPAWHSQDLADAIRRPGARPP